MKNNLSPKIRPLPLLAVILLLAVVTTPFLRLGHASAALGTFQTAYVRLDRMKGGVTTGGRVCAKPDATNLAQTEAIVKVTFPTDSSAFTLAAAASWTVTTTGLEAGQTAWPGIGTATNVTGMTVTFPSGDLTSSTNLYCFNFASTVTIPAAATTETSAGNVLTQTAAGATDIDQTFWSFGTIISNDQVVVTGTVPPSFSFSFAGGSDPFVGNIVTTGNPTYTSGKSVTITTNAAGGWIIWAKSGTDNGGGKGSLNSATAANYKVTNTGAVGSAAHTFPDATENYGLGVTAFTDAGGGGTVSIPTAYDGTAFKGGTLDATAFQQIANANGTANGDVVTFKELAKATGTTPAASDYTDTITIIGAGVF
jgi:hypothetical protein